mmetsp:Transcript_80352/g.236394  ORF Transcript_80352/g.236394 Transcript_80352/m.236394 type:complete len:771 (-) Transcript_80352:924-3236(-)
MKQPARTTREEREVGHVLARRDLLEAAAWREAGSRAQVLHALPPETADFLGAGGVLQDLARLQEEEGVQRAAPREDHLPLLEGELLAAWQDQGQELVVTERLQRRQPPEEVQAQGLPQLALELGLGVRAGGGEELLVADARGPDLALRPDRHAQRGALQQAAHAKVLAGAHDHHHVLVLPREGWQLRLAQEVYEARALGGVLARRKAGAALNKVEVLAWEEPPGDGVSCLPGLVVEALSHALPQLRVQPAQQGDALEDDGQCCLVHQGDLCRGEGCRQILAIERQNRDLRHAPHGHLPRLVEEERELSEVGASSKLPHDLLPAVDHLDKVAHARLHDEEPLAKLALHDDGPMRGKVPGAHMADHAQLLVLCQHRAREGGHTLKLCPDLVEDCGDSLPLDLQERGVRDGHERALGLRARVHQRFRPEAVPGRHGLGPVHLQLGEVLEAQQVPLMFRHLPTLEHIDCVQLAALGHNSSPGLEENLLDLCSHGVEGLIREAPQLGHLPEEEDLHGGVHLGGNLVPLLCLTAGQDLLVTYGQGLHLVARGHELAAQLRAVEQALHAKVLARLQDVSLLQCLCGLHGVHARAEEVTMVPLHDPALALLHDVEPRGRVHGPRQRAAPAPALAPQALGDPDLLRRRQLRQQRRRGAEPRLRRRPHLRQASPLDDRRHILAAQPQRAHLRGRHEADLRGHVENDGGLAEEAAAAGLSNHVPTLHGVALAALYDDDPVADLPLREQALVPAEGREVQAPGQGVLLLPRDHVQGEEGHPV